MRKPAVNHLILVLGAELGRRIRFPPVCLGCGLRYVAPVLFVSAAAGVVFSAEQRRV